MIDPVSLSLRPPQHDQLREERLEILRLLEAGTITVAEAATLLDALDRAAPPANTVPAAPGGAEARQIRIRVTDSTTGKATVNLAFPLGLIDSGLAGALQFLPEYLPQAEAIRESIRAGVRGSLVDIDDGEQRVEIIAE